MKNVKRLFIISFFCTAIFAYANVAKGNEKTTASLCNKNETIDLTQFESQADQVITGGEKDILLHELFNNQKTQNLISGLSTGEQISSTVLKTKGTQGAEKLIYGIVFEKGILNYIIVKNGKSNPIETGTFTNDDKNIVKIQSLKNNLQENSKERSFSDMMLGKVPRPQDITANCTGCAGPGEDQTGRTKKLSKYHVDETCRAEFYQDCITQPECTHPACLSGCSAAAYAYCTYKEEYCEDCPFIPADKNLQKSPWTTW